MFRIEVFVDDKHVTKVLRAVAGVARGQPSVIPVANVADGKGKPKAATDGSLFTMFERYIRTRPPKTTLSPADVRQWLAAHGGSQGSVFYITSMAMKRRLLRRTGKGAQVKYFPTSKKG